MRVAEPIRRNPVLVIGATGHVGREVVSGLLAKSEQVRAMTRNPAAAGLPLGAEVVYGDLAFPESLDDCLDGIDTVFLVWTAPVDAVVPALDRIASRARRIVYLSSPLKTPHPFFQQPNPSRVLSERIEALIENSELEWTFLRPGIFALNSVGWWSAQIRAGDVVRWPYATVHTAPVHERDIAEVAVETLCGSGHGGKDYVLTGPESLSQAEQITILGDVVDRSLRVEDLTRDEAERELLAHYAAVRHQDAAGCMGRGRRPTCVCDDDVHGGDEQAATDVSRMGDGERRRIPRKAIGLQCKRTPGTADR